MGSALMLHAAFFLSLNCFCVWYPHVGGGGAGGGGGEGMQYLVVTGSLNVHIGGARHALAAFRKARQELSGPATSFLGHFFAVSLRSRR